MRQLFIPVPGDEHGAVTRAPRLKTLAGVKIGLLGNLKPNCDVLLHTKGATVLSVPLMHALDAVHWKRLEMQDYDQLIRAERPPPRRICR